MSQLEGAPTNSFIRRLKRAVTKIGLRGVLLPIWRPLALNSRTLRELGWYQSAFKGLATDAAGEPIPWWTYPAISFLDHRISPESEVFEFGSGHSTLWLAKRAKTVTSVEYNPAWSSYILDRAPDNVEVMLVEDLDEFSESIKRTGRDFDIIVIDGGKRDRCSQAALGHLRDTGVVIWDNSDWPLFQQVWASLFARSTFKELPFTGLQPIEHSISQTSIIYRPNNCLNI